ncbi:aldo/keto reductase [Synechococcus sp. HB1133]|uniref:aldo/keto reductase n=1 Tax=unclassified Synechococcus TaxID=2626047 RepID=UPI001407D6AD
MAQLCLGTVQFGLPYGITNQHGQQVPASEVRRILSLASQSGIELFDTAQAYGDAETVLGNCWLSHQSRRLISKLPPGAPMHTWEMSLAKSMARLKTSKLDSFILHRSSDLLSKDGENLLSWLEGLRSRGLVERIGVSIYNVSDLNSLPLDRLQLVQLPLSVYDQRLLRDGTIEMLCELGISVHARSIFLQGLLLQSPANWPDRISPLFRDHHARWLKHLHYEELSPLAASLGFVRSCHAVEAVLVGVQSLLELTQVLEAWRNSESVVHSSYSEFAWDTASDLDPRCWS